MTRTAQFENKVKTTVDYIYSSTKTTPFCEGFSKFKDGMMSKCGSALVKHGYILNDGSHTAPSYVWNTQYSPNKRVYEVILTEIREKAKKKAPASSKKIEDTTKSFSLSSLTDQQLWDELKLRGYSITDNKLAKQIFLS